MSKLLVKPQAERGQVIHITPQSAGWRHVGFDVHKLAAGESVAAKTGEREVCLVLVSGKARISAGGKDFSVVGERMTPFEGKPHSVYVPGGSDWRAEAATELTLAVCSAPSTGGKLAPRHIAPQDTGQETRGKGTNVRYVTNILPLESLLEETYYHRLNPPQGFAFQRVYTDDRSLDEAIVVEDGSVVMVPRGYHPTAAIHGYDLYYLNVMAGPRRTWKFHNAREHEWLVKG